MTTDNLIGQYAPPVRILQELKPENIFVTPARETILDVGQVVAGVVKFTVTASEGITITLEHSEVLDTEGNGEPWFFSNFRRTPESSYKEYLVEPGG